MPGIDRLPIAIPASVTMAVSVDNVISVKDPKGELIRAMSKDMSITVEGNQVVVIRPSDQKRHRALHGLARVLISNMIIRAEEGFEKSPELVGVGHRAQLQGKKSIMNSGYSHPVEIEPIEGVTFETPAAIEAVIRSIDKEKVGATAADIRSWREPEPYKGKGIKYDNEVIERGEGKTDKK